MPCHFFVRVVYARPPEQQPTGGPPHKLKEAKQYCFWADGDSPTGTKAAARLRLQELLGSSWDVISLTLMATTPPEIKAIIRPRPPGGKKVS